MAAVPTTFGKYFLTEKIARGGMAEIYLAKLIGPGGFEKQLIIKQIHPELSGRAQFVQLFVDEAKTLVGLSHGNIVPVYELGVVNETYFIAMEYIDGPTLDQLMRNLKRKARVMDPSVAAYITSELLKGLDYAHRKGEGVIHRDLSPRNVMLSREGEVKLVDFGLAVAVDGRAPAAGKGGRPVGSFPYMSPEQVRRDPLDGQSDLFSAGVLFWEMLTGETLFSRQTEDDTLDAVLHAPIPSPSALQRDLPPGLDQIALRALARNRDERYPNAGAFLAPVNKYVYSADEPVTPRLISDLVAENCPPRRRKRPESAALPPAESAAGEPGQMDHTRPMDGRTHGKKQPDTVQTFATHIEFEGVLAKHTPMMPFQAIGEAEAAVIEAKARDRRNTSGKAPRSEPSRNRPNRMPWAIATVAVIAGIAAIALAMRNAETPVAAQTADGGPAPTADASVQPTDASEVQPAAGDATPPVVARADAKPARKRPDAGAIRPAGHGVIKVGASPRGDIYVDGTLMGEAPGQVTVSAGKHTVMVRYKDQKKTFTVEVENGTTVSRFAEFEN